MHANRANLLSGLMPALVLCLLVCVLLPKCVAQGGTVAWSEGFEGRFVEDDWYAENGIWELGTPTTGPGGAFSGRHAYGTVMDGNYPHVPDSRLIGPPINLPEVATGEELLLRFRQWFSYQASDGGDVQIQVFDPLATVWGGWTNLVQVRSWIPDWHHARVDLSTYAGQRVRLAFSHSDGTELDGFGRDNHSESSGWFLDDLAIVAQPKPVLPSVEGWELGWDGWWSSNGIWEPGVPEGIPGGVPGGTHVMGTRPAADYPYGPDSGLYSPEIDLPVIASGEELLLRFRQWFSYQGADGGDVQIQSFDAETEGLGRGGEHQERPKLDSGVASCADRSSRSTPGNGFGSGSITSMESSWLLRCQRIQSSGWFLDDLEIIAQLKPVLHNSEGWETGWEGWWSDNDIWEVGSTFAGGAFNGTNVVGTGLTSNYPNGPDSSLHSPEAVLPSLAAGEELLLRFRQWFSYQGSDGGDVQIQSFDVPAEVWGGWETIKSVRSWIPGWHHARIDISKFAGQRVRLRFNHFDGNEGCCGANAQSSGWFLDDLEIIAQPKPVLHNPEGWENGWNGWWSDNDIWEVGVPVGGPEGLSMEPMWSVRDLTSKLSQWAGQFGLHSPGGSPARDRLAAGRNCYSASTSGSAIRGPTAATCRFNLSTCRRKRGGDGKPSRASEVGFPGGITYGLTSHRVPGNGFGCCSVTSDGTELDGCGGNIHAESSGWFLDDLEIIVQAKPVLRNPEGWEKGWKGWWSDNGIWELGVPTGGPGGAYGGTNVMATGLTANYPYGPDSNLYSPEINLPAVAAGEELLLRFRQRYRYQNSDGGNLLLRTFDPDSNSWGEWVMMMSVRGEVPDWVYARVDVSAYAGRRIRLSFSHIDGTELDGFGRNIHAESSGWFLDEIRIQTQAMIVPREVLSVNEEELLTIRVESTLGGSRFGLGVDAPAGMQVDPDLGILTWVPSECQGALDQRFHRHIDPSLVECVAPGFPDSHGNRPGGSETAGD